MLAVSQDKIFRYILLKQNKTVTYLLKDSKVVRHCSHNEKVSKKLNKVKYKSSCLFPTTNFFRNPLGAERIKIEREVQEKENFTNLYDKQRNGNGVEYILHDGPPYANGSLHLGHALNKILKDIINRSQLLMGKRIHFMTGWDCHGLPIELKALEDDKNKDCIEWKKLPPLEIRKKANTVASENVQIQKGAFKRWGIMTNWEKIYKTNSPNYIAKELRMFAKLFEDGYLFRANLPVYFSPSSLTCLAESELIYKSDHVSPSLHIGVALTKESMHLLDKFVSIPAQSKVLLAIWTTTPWSLPANVAVMASDKDDYLVIEKAVSYCPILMIWSEKCLQAAKDCFGEVKVRGKIPGKSLCGLKYHHPLYKHTCPVLASSHVITDKGTGLVHTAPTHGKDDFVWAVQNNIRTDFQLVDENGCYIEEAGSNLSGKCVISEGNQAVLDIIKSFESSANGAVILNLGEIEHSYPYDWRTDKPVMVRSSLQWFFDINRVKNKAVESLSDVNTIPENLKSRLIYLINSRPYWCISRQRTWGVPIPVFYDAKGEAVVDRNIIEHVASLIEKDGCDIWWKYPEEKLLPSEYVKKMTERKECLPTKGKDILDIWFDSGASNYCVLDGVTADLYVEGVDQDSGWFQSSLLLSVATTGKAPFRNLLVHNFVVDDQLRKMSKSVGNIILPSHITEFSKGSNNKKTCGINILRLWVAHANIMHNIKMGPVTLNNMDNILTQIRQSIWFCLSSIGDFTTSKIIPYQNLRTFDKYIMWKVGKHLKKVWSEYEAYRIQLALQDATNVIGTIMSTEYMNSVKDLIYCEPDSANRRSVQTTVYQILPHLLASIAPILPHLVEEAASHFHNTEQGPNIFSNYTSNTPTEWEAESLLETFQQFEEIKELFIAAATSKCTGIYANQSALFTKYRAVIRFGSKYEHVLKEFQKERVSYHSDLVSIFTVSQIELQFIPDEADHLSIEVEESNEEFCLRCHKYCAPVGNELCQRCQQLFETYTI